MNPNEVFIQEANHMIATHATATTHPGTYYVLYADITDFHTINHIYGIETGNGVLQDMEWFLGNCPEVLLCSRLFADFFLCLCYLEAGDEIGRMMGEYDAGVRAFLEGQRERYPACGLKAACGVCRIEKGDVAQAIDNANVARKVSKKQLSVKSVLYNQDIQEQISTQYATEQEIYQAMQEDRFRFYLQPKVDLTNGEIIGAEALARRIGKDGEVIYPDVFLQLMESSGAVIELDRSICRQVCSFLAERLRQGKPVVSISVNLSRLHISNPNSADEFHGIVTEYNIPPELLEFELTETILLEEFTGAKQLIDQLRAYGHKVSIDDFGSGYAGINIWQELNFDCLKLDRKFLSDSEALKSRNEALVPNIINIAQRLHVQVLCEGVETEEQCQYLLQLGCTVVQGFFFAKPMPPEQLCRMCERHGHYYPLPPSLQAAQEKEMPKATRAVASERRSWSRLRQYMLVVIGCALFLGACITGVLTVSRNLTQREFNRMVMETLNAYTVGQRENTLTEIDGVAATLQSLAVLILKDDSPDFINAYLRALNEDSRDVKYMYFSIEEFQKEQAEGRALDSDADAMSRLAQGEMVVTDIMYSERMGNIYCIGVGIPVIRDGEFIGAVRGVINAKSLISTDLYDPAQGEVLAVFLTDCTSRILPTHKTDEGNVDYLLLDYLEASGIDQEAMRELREAFATEDLQARSVRIGEFDGSPFYLSLTGLKYNGWHLVVCLKADAATKHSQYIVRNTAGSILGLLVAVVLASGVIMLFVVRMQKKFSLEEQRYLLLERFSDTVLFDYDCQRDTIRFTSNATKVLRIHALEQMNFMEQYDQSYVYAGDQKEMRRMLTRAGKDESGETRLRLLRPDSDDYFWCLVQYQYLYEKDRLASVIGKITDIDEHMRHEDYLLRMSETDGLTGLLNKATVEQQTADRLLQRKSGSLFVIDVDGFKQINDQYGHAAGDLALRFLGECMRRTFRNTDILGRIGGDELLAFVEDINSQAMAQKKAELLAKHLESCTEAGVPPITVSIGIACCPEDGTSYQELFHAADRSMYAAKQRMRGR